MEKENKLKIGAIIIVLVTSSTFSAFAAYNAGKGDGRKEMLLRIAACSIQDAQSGKCFIPCAGDDDCFLKNGFVDN